MYDYCYSFTGSWSYVYLLFIFYFSLSFRLFKCHWSILLIILSSLINTAILNLPNTFKNIWYCIFFLIIWGFFANIFCFYCLKDICNKRIFNGNHKSFFQIIQTFDLSQCWGQLVLFSYLNCDSLFLLHVFLLLYLRYAAYNIRKLVTLFRFKMHIWPWWFRGGLLFLDFKSGNTRLGFPLCAGWPDLRYPVVFLLKTLHLLLAVFQVFILFFYSCVMCGF